MKKTHVAFRINKKIMHYTFAAVLILTALIIVYKAMQRWEFTNNGLPGSSEDPSYAVDDQVEGVMIDGQWYILIYLTLVLAMIHSYLLYHLAIILNL